MIIKAKSDVKKVLSIMELVKNREESILLLDFEKFSTIVSEFYYEIIKELSSALILLEGFKSVGENSHKDLIDFLLRYKGISEKEISLIHDLRIRRNKSSYEGVKIDAFFLNVHKSSLLEIIKKLKSLINLKLKKRW